MKNSVLGEFPDVPICPGCGEYMEVLKTGNSVAVFECCNCGIDKTKVSPSQKLDVYEFF